MKTSHRNLVRFLGFVPTGDLGPWTIYTAKDRGVVVFDRAPPKVPPSPKQQYRQAQFAYAARQWRRLPPETRDAWTRAARKANLRITPLNLWMHWQIKRDRAIIATIERQTGIQLL